MANLWMAFDTNNRQWQHVLSIPVQECQRFAIYPLTWLCYLAFTINGCEGIISSQPDGDEIQYYDDIQAGDYYHVSQESFLLDPDLMNDRTTATSDVSTGRGDFAHRVNARDGKCVMTGNTNPRNLAACHVVPHSKGHQYIINLGHHRHEVLNPPLDNINDTRNGILLNTILHASLGASESAFLKTPNFAMTVNDVDLENQHEKLNPGFTTPPSHASKRLTFQHFVSDSLVQVLAPHNSDARITDCNDWPPPFLFDAAYGCAALKTWGQPPFVNFAREHTRRIYYEDDNGDENGGGGGGGNDSGGGIGGGSGGGGGSTSKTPREERLLKREKVKQQGRRRADSDVPDAADIILGLWMYNARKVKAQVRAMKASRNQQKVEAWRNSVQ